MIVEVAFKDKVLYKGCVLLTFTDFLPYSLTCHLNLSPDVTATGNQSKHIVTDLSGCYCLVWSS